jgi:hypothetical protein
MKYLIRQTLVYEVEIEASNKEEADDIFREIPWDDICEDLLEKTNHGEYEITEIQ